MGALPEEFWLKGRSSRDLYVKFAPGIIRDVFRCAIPQEFDMF
jgi:hypothetical protein